MQDTGIGISKAFLDNDMFTPFRQQDTHSAGTGLGLSIVRHIANELGAEVGIESAEGKGTQ